MNEIEYIKRQLSKGDFDILPSSIAIGTVFKVSFFGSLEEDGYEVGYLYLPKGGGIKVHTHIDNIERYLLLMGELSVNGERLDANICSLKREHNIDPVNKDTIIQTCKISKFYLDQLADFSNDSFDVLVYQGKSLTRSISKCRYFL